jgi:glycosyltransferase involved in cell wall biosynthesis
MSRIIAKPLVSVVVPTRNSARFLGACLESINRQTYRPIEVIVVDNRSADTTRQIAQHHGSRVFVWGPERSAQVNFGVLQATGEYIYKVDSDFVVDERVVESCVAKIADGFDAVVVHNSPDVRVSWIARIRKFEVDMYKYDLTHSSARFFKRRVYEAIGGFNEDMTAGEDYDFQNRLNAAGFKTGFVTPEALHLGEPTSFWKHMRKYYTYGSDFVTYTRANPTMSRMQLRFVRSVYVKNWRRFVRHPLRGVIFVVYSLCKFAAGGTGFLVGRFQASRAVRGER